MPNQRRFWLSLLAETAPTALFIYSFPAPSERFLPQLRSVLVQAKPILHARWNPVRHGVLVLCCGGGGLYTWSNEWIAGDSDKEEEMAECIGIPASMFYVVDVIRTASLILLAYSFSQRNSICAMFGGPRTASRYYCLIKTRSAVLVKLKTTMTETHFIITFLPLVCFTRTCTLAICCASLLLILSIFKDDRRAQVGSVF